MCRRLATLTSRVMESVQMLGCYVVEILRSGWQALRYQDDQVPIEVLVASGLRRRRIERELRVSLRQLQHILGPPPLGDIAIVVQEIIAMERQLAGCYQLRQRPDGSQSVLLRV